jgi:hypothetical protein
LSDDGTLYKVVESYVKKAIQEVGL